MRFDQIVSRVRQRPDDDGGFSIVMTVIFAAVLSVMNAANVFQERTESQSDARLAIDTLVRDVRQAYTGIDLMPSVVFPVSATTLKFYAPDRTANDFHLREITYKMAAGSGILTRSVKTSTNLMSNAVTAGIGWQWPPGLVTDVTVLTGITNASIFTYKDQTATQLLPVTSLSLRAVVIDLVIDRSPSTSPTPQTYHTQVDLRVTNNV